MKQTVQNIKKEKAHKVKNKLILNVDEEQVA